MYDNKGAAPSVLVADITSLNKLGDITRRGGGCNEDQRLKCFDSKSSENSRAEQSRLATPAMSVVQHTATLGHTAPLALASPLVVRPLPIAVRPLLPPAAAGGAARATATLAATVLIMKKNRMLMRSSWVGLLGVDF